MSAAALARLVPIGDATPTMDERVTDGTASGGVSGAADTWPLSARVAALALGFCERTVRRAIAREGVEYTLTPFKDKEFSAVQADKIRTQIAARTKELPPRDFVEMLRAAITNQKLTRDFATNWRFYDHRRFAQ